jgi:hypothetical protein
MNLNLRLKDEDTQATQVKLYSSDHAKLKKYCKANHISILQLYRHLANEFIDNVVDKE